MLKTELQELKKKYCDLKDEIYLEKANGSLSKLANLRETFDETFDSFFDCKELRVKYDAWNIDCDEPDFDISNGELEEKLDDADLKELLQFYKDYLGKLEDELNKLKQDCT